MAARLAWVTAPRGHVAIRALGKQSLSPGKTSQWLSLGLRSDVANALALTGLSEPTAIQSRAIPPVLEGKSSVIAAETGSGKTMAYLAPLMSRLCAPEGMSAKGRPSLVILCPNATLCDQVINVARKLVSGGCELEVGLYNPGNLRQPDIVASTPRKFARDFLLLDEKKHRRKGAVEMPECVVFDEADMLLEGSFQDDSVNILTRANKQGSQSVFAAATLPRFGKKTPGKVLEWKMNGEVEWIEGPRLHRSLERVENRWIHVDDEVTWRKRIMEALRSVPGKACVFCRTSERANEVLPLVRDSGVNAVAFHKGVKRDEAQSNLDKFCRGEVTCLVATDAAARGLDMPDVEHVIQADFAESAMDFLHRQGRTGRVGKPGTVTNIYWERERPLVNAVRSALEENRPVEGAFSRRRLFAKKRKKGRLNLQTSSS